MKKVIRVFALAIAVFGVTNANAGIPVIDVAAIAQQVQQVIAWGKQYTQMVDQINNLRNQYSQLQTTYNSLTGDRGLATLLNAGADQAARRYLPEQADELEKLSAGLVSGYGPLQSSIASLRSKVSSLPPGTFGAGTDALKALSAKLDSIATQQAMGKAAYSAAAQRTRDIENLIATSGVATDPKAIAEMQTRITAQQALLQNESSKLQAMAYMQQTEQAQNEQRANETISKWGKTTLPAVAF
jgi:type IV secretion system protein VirB5